MSAPSKNIDAPSCRLESIVSCAAKLKMSDDSQYLLKIEPSKSNDTIS